MIIGHKKLNWRDRGIAQLQNDVNNRPLLSIAILAYNNEPYIEQAIQSVLMQRTNFKYEVVIGEDCSTDRTREIVRRYAKLYPNRIKALLHEKNFGMNKNACIVRNACSGKYLAMLDGDNYWIDPDKLQKQVDFLQENPNYIGVAHKVRVIEKNGTLSQEAYYAAHCMDTVFSLSHAQRGMLPGQIGTWVFRNIFLDFSEKQHALYESCRSVGDSKLAVILALFGDFYCSREVMSAFRLVTDEQSFSSRSYSQNLSLEYMDWIEEREKLAWEAFGRRIDCTPAKLDIAYHAFVAFVKKLNRENCSIFREVMKRETNRFAAYRHIIVSGIGVVQRRRQRMRIGNEAR